MTLPFGAARDVPSALAEIAMHHARRIGVPLSELEGIGASLEACEAFILAAEGTAPDWKPILARIAK
ncbi:MAG: hypothetical protein ACYDCK_14360 [Thermoplasmatota archaeon]